MRTLVDAVIRGAGRRFGWVAAGVVLWLIAQAVAVVTR